MRSLVVLLSSFCLPSVVLSQWALQTSPSHSNLLSVSARENTVWASGMDGTVLFSADGNSWKACAALPDGHQAEVRSIQAVDATTAVAMTTGRGERSRLYRTTDACQSWQKVFDNTEEQSSFDSLRLATAKQLYLLGEPVAGKFTLYLSQDAGATWFIADDPGLETEPGESAAGSTLSYQAPFLYFGTHGGTAPVVHYTYAKCDPAQPDVPCAAAWGKSKLPPGIAKGINAVGARMQTGMTGKSTTTLMAAGEGTTPEHAFIGQSQNNGARWGLPAAPPSGVLRSMSFISATQTWLACGTAGTFLSADEGKSWQAAKGPNQTAGWNSVSLPYAVGDSGQIGKLETVRK